jgi:tRNA nucleotidyltransferase/poly(A) polymerase
LKDGEAAMDEEAYAGRWVARLRGRIIAQGGTPEQARDAALSRYKETPEIVFMPFTGSLSLPPLFDEILAVIPADLSLYLVGGAVRDLLLGRQSHDYDFVLVKGGISTARRVADHLKADFYPLDPQRDTGRVLVNSPDGRKTVLDFATFRGAGPDPNLEADLRGRDFTLNAMAIELRHQEMLDPLGGALDLKDGLLRPCSPSAFTDDPVRILRGVRLAAEYHFHIQPEARRAMKTAVPGLRLISAERLRDELFRILEGRTPGTCLRALEMLGALKVILPELKELKGVSQPPPHVHDTWEHSLAVMGSLEGVLEALGEVHDPEKAADLYNGLLVLRLGRYRVQINALLGTSLAGTRTLRGLLFLSALYHDVAKPAARKTDDDGQIRFWEHDQQGEQVAGERGRALALSNDEIDRLEKIVRNHMRLLFHINRLVKEGKQPSRRAIYRFFRDAGQAGVDLCLLALADLRGTYENTLPQETWAAALDVVRLMLENWFEKPAESITPPVLVNGDDLMRELGLPPGPTIGEILEAIREAQAMGDVTTREQALTLARSRMA